MSDFGEGWLYSNPKRNKKRPVRSDKMSLRLPLPTLQKNLCVYQFFLLDSEVTNLKNIRFGIKCASCPAAYSHNTA